MPNEFVTTLTPFCYTMNFSCYYAAFFSSLKEMLFSYTKINVLAAERLWAILCEASRSFLEAYWIAILYAVVTVGLIFGFNKMLGLIDADEPLTQLEAEITHYIHVNASTGCTARMLYEYLESLDETHRADMNNINKVLQNLKKKGVILPVQATLWVVSGN